MPAFSGRGGVRTAARASTKRGLAGRQIAGMPRPARVGSGAARRHRRRAGSRPPFSPAAARATADTQPLDLGEEGELRRRHHQRQDRSRSRGRRRSPSTAGSTTASTARRSVISRCTKSTLRPKAIGSTPRTAAPAVSSTGRARSRQVLQDRLLDRHALAPQPVIGVDQHDVVVRHDAGQRDDADAGHHDAEGLAHDHQAEEHADRRQDDRRTAPAPTLDSLLNWASSTAKIRKIAAPNALPRKALGLGRAPRPRRSSFQLTRPLKSVVASSLGDLLLHRGGLHALGDVGGDRDHALAVDAVDDAGRAAPARARRSCRSAPSPPASAMRRSSIWLSVRRSSGTRTMMSTGLSLVCRPVVGDLQAVGDELHHRADRRRRRCRICAASALSISSRQSMPGIGRPLSRSRISGRLASSPPTLQRRLRGAPRDSRWTAGSGSACRSAARPSAPSPRP